MSKGRLIQPFVYVEWGGKNLSAYDSGVAPVQPIVYGISVTMAKDGQAPQLKFSFTPSPIGFEVFSELKKNNMADPIKVKIGYYNPAGALVEFETEYRYTGNNFSSGLDMSVEVQAVGRVKGGWTDNRISYTMEEEKSLAEMPQFIQSKCGKPCEHMKFEFKGKAKEAAQKIMIKGNQTQRTPHVILNDHLKSVGMEMAIGDSAIDNKMIIQYSEAKEGELKADMPKEKSATDKPESGARKVYLLGPGLLTTINRQQTFNVGQNSTQGGASQDQPVSAEGTTKDVVEKGSGPQTSSADAQNKQGGTEGPANESTGQSAITKGDKKTMKEARAAIAKMVTTSCSTECFMVPYMVGIKPRDVIAIPSLTGTFLEDWIVDGVTYTQSDTGEVMISINGQRPYTGEENLLDSGTVAKLLEKVKTLQSTQAWADYYWSGN